jgi:hypothetical protein
VPFVLLLSVAVGEMISLALVIMNVVFWQFYLSFVSFVLTCLFARDSETRARKWLDILERDVEL